MPRKGHFATTSSETYALIPGKYASGAGRYVPKLCLKNIALKI